MSEYSATYLGPDGWSEDVSEAVRFASLPECSARVSEIEASDRDSDGSCTYDHDDERPAPVLLSCDGPHRVKLVVVCRVNGDEMRSMVSCERCMVSGEIEIEVDAVKWAP